MRDKAIVFLLLVLVALPILAPTVSAAGEDLLGGIGQNIVTTIQNILNYELTFPAATIYGDKYAANKSPLWVFILTFMIIFSILWLASAQVPLFKDQENKGPRKAFAIGFSFLVMLGTPMTAWLLTLTKTFAQLTYIAMLVLGVYTIWVIFKGGWASSRKSSAAAAQSMAEATRSLAETKRMGAQTLTMNEKTIRATANGIFAQKKAIVGLRNDLTTLLKDFNDIRPAALKELNGSALRNNAKSKNIIKALAKITGDAGKILSFNTENDRKLSGMSTAGYALKDASSPGKGILTELKDGKAVVNDMDTQTSDLGHTLSAMAQMINADGIFKDSIDKLITWNSTAINITNRMERDLVLEDQMIEKI